MKEKEAIKFLEEMGYDIKKQVENLLIKELSIEVTPLEKWTKPYNQIEIPEGYRLLRLSEFLYIWENENYRNVFLKDYLDKPEWKVIWLEQLWNDKRNKWSRRVYLDGSLNLESSGGNLAYSDEYGRVAFVRDLKKEKLT